MKLRFLLMFLIFTLPVFAVPQRTDLIGYKHKGVKYGETLPNGAKDLGGGLLSEEDYGVTRFARGKKYMLWLEKITGRDSRGVPDWEVKDVLMFDALKKNQAFNFSYSSGCLQNGRENLDLIVMTEFSPAKKFYKPVKAWRVNFAKGKFEKIPVRGITCKEASAEQYD